MSILNNSLLLGAPAGAAAYQISRSLRFNSADSAYLNRTYGSSSNQTIWTFSCWVKRAALGSEQAIFSAKYTTGYWTAIDFTSSDQLRFRNVWGSDSQTKTTSQVFRDPSAWYHIVISIKLNEASTDNGIRFYVNGTQITTFSTSTYTNSFNTTAIAGAYAHSIGRNEDTAGSYLSAYLADAYFVQAQNLTPSSFGETDATTGQWVPKVFSGGSYGGNGFRLDLSDNSAATAATLGADRSGNGNNYTPNNLSITAGVGNDSLVDSPTSYGTDTGAGGEVRGNYATLNPISTVTTVALANGNLDYSSTTTGQNALATIGMSSGKWYWEVVTTAGTTDTRVGVYSTAASSLFSLAANSTVYGIRFNADTGELDRTSDGTNWTSIATGLTSGPYFPYFNNNGTTSKTVSTNFGQRPFAYTAPSGFKALCTTNLTAPTIAKPSTVFDVKTYSGNSTNPTTISGFEFDPDFAWVKARNSAQSHALGDAVRGSGNVLRTDLTAAELTGRSDILGGFATGGIIVGDNALSNASGTTYVAYGWDAGSSNASNTSGTISSTVRANTSAGFSIVTYTGNGTAGATIGHGLGVAPTLIMIKARSAANPWNIYTTVIDGSLDYFSFDTGAKLDSAQSVPTSSVFSVSSGVNVNGNGTTYVAYCWSPIAGYSQVGKYTGTGNGGNGGPFVYTGHRSAWIVAKRSDSAGSWYLIDNRRNGRNIDPNGNMLIYPDLSNTEASIDWDILSNGFKMRDAGSDLNANGGTYLYVAFAEFPFQYARAR